MKLSLKHKLKFGKYKGKTLYEIIKAHPLYIEWCLENKIFKLTFFSGIIYRYNLKKFNKERQRIYDIFRALCESGWIDDGNGNSGFINEPSDI
jgi:hypothetical protein